MLLIESDPRVTAPLLAEGEETGESCPQGLPFSWRPFRCRVNPGLSAVWPPRLDSSGRVPAPASEGPAPSCRGPGSRSPSRLPVRGHVCPRLHLTGPSRAAASGEGDRRLLLCLDGTRGSGRGGSEEAVLRVCSSDAFHSCLSGTRVCAGHASWLPPRLLSATSCSTHGLEQVFGTGNRSLGERRRGGAEVRRPRRADLGRSAPNPRLRPVRGTRGPKGRRCGLQWQRTRPASFSFPGTR